MTEHQAIATIERALDRWQRAGHAIRLGSTFPSDRREQERRLMALDEAVVAAGRLPASETLLDAIQRAHSAMGGAA